MQVTFYFGKITAQIAEIVKVVTDLTTVNMARNFMVGCS